MNNGGNYAVHKPSAILTLLAGATKVAPWRAEQIFGDEDMQMRWGKKVGMGGASLAVIAALAAAAWTTPVAAQKAQDTMRFPVQNMEAGIDSYLFPGTFHYIWAPSVYDNLLGFDPVKGKFVGQLAKSWSQPNATTYEYELRDDIKWQDGQPLTADDVVYTIDYLIDPKVKLRNKANWTWIQSVEKLGPYKVRIVAKSPVPDGMMRMAESTYIFPKHVHGPLANKAEFGARPVGTGPLKITQFDTNTGIIAERNPSYVPTTAKAAAGIGKVVAVPMNDTGTIVAAMLVGQADVAVELAPDQVAGLEATGRFEVSLGPPGLAHSFMGFPSAAVENVKALGDVRVRKAIAMAIDRRQQLIVQYGDRGKTLKPMEALCFKAQLGCGYNKLMPAYDPAGAKKLLAEAGYPDGFDVTISTYPINMDEVTAVAGMLRAVGIRASVRAHPFSQRDLLLRQGKVEIGYYGWSGGAIFDVSTTISRHFLRDEYADPVLKKMAAETYTIMDDAERRKAVAKVLDYATENAYIFPMIPLRPPITHIKDLQILAKEDLRAVYQPAMHEFGWK